MAQDSGLDGWPAWLVFGAAKGSSNSFWKATVTRLGYC